jgi:hypothetical protein
MDLLAMVHLSFSVLNMAVSQNFIISRFSKQFMNLDARGLGAKNTTRAQIDSHHAYLTCHIENLKKSKVISRKSVVEGSCKRIQDKCGIRGSLHGMQRRIQLPETNNSHSGQNPCGGFFQSREFYMDPTNLAKGGN